MDIVEWLFLSCALGLGLMVGIGAAVQDIVPLTIPTLAISFALFFTMIFLVRVKMLDNGFRVVLPETKRIHALLIIPLLISFFVWRSAYGIHSIDMGWHAFWSQQVSNQGHLPNYSLIEPYDQASRFIFGPDLVLGIYSILTTLPTGPISWVPLAIYSSATIGAIYAIATKASPFRYSGLAASTIYSAANVPGGFIQRGNLPDIMGFFLLLAVLYLLLLRGPDWKTIGMGSFLYCTCFAFHPYAAIVVSGILFIRVSIWILANSRRIIPAIKASPWTRAVVRGAPLGLLVAPIILPQLAFFNLKSTDQIRGIDYTGYVPNPEQFASILTSTFGFLMIIVALGGVGVLLLSRKNTKRIILLAWLAILTGLVYSPLVGIGLEPIRFIWRMTEPLSVLGGIFIGAILEVKGPFQKRHVPSLAFLETPAFRISQPVLVLLILSLVVIPPVLGSQTTYVIAQTNYGSDTVIGRWLMQNGNLTGRVAVDAEYDNSATWIMYYSNYPLFLYRVNFAAGVAPYPYRQVFIDLRSILDAPSSATSALYLQKYSIQYLVTAAPDQSAFQKSPYLRLVFTYGSVGVFEIHQ